MAMSKVAPSTDKLLCCIRNSIFAERVLHGKATLIINDSALCVNGDSNNSIEKYPPTKSCYDGARDAKRSNITSIRHEVIDDQQDDEPGGPDRRVHPGRRRDRGGADTVSDQSVRRRQRRCPNSVQGVQQHLELSALRLNSRRERRTVHRFRGPLRY